MEIPLYPAGYIPLRAKALYGSPKYASVQQSKGLAIGFKMLPAGSKALPETLLTGFKTLPAGSEILPQGSEAPSVVSPFC